MRWITLGCVVLAAISLASCAAESFPSSATLAPGERPTPTPLPTPEGWTPAQVPITLDTAPQIRELGRLDVPEPPSTIFAYALSLDNTQLAALNNDFVIAWDLLTGHVRFSASRQGANVVLFAPDRERLYTLDQSGGIRIYGTARGGQIDTLRSRAGYNGTYAYDPLGGWLALGTTDGQIQVWDMPARTSIGLLNGPEVSTAALAFSPDGTVLAAADANGTITLWDFEQRSAIVTEPLLAPVYALAYSPDGSTLAANTADGVLLLNTGTLGVVAQLTGEPNSGVFQFMTGADILLLGGETGTVTAWNVANHTLAATLPETGGSRPSAAASPDGSMLFTSNLSAGASLWNVSDIGSSSVLRGALTLPSENALRVVWTSDSLQILLFETLGPVRVFGIP